MSAFLLYLLTGDGNLADLIRALLPDAELVTAPCLNQFTLMTSAFWLVIDPRWVKSCCLNRLALWRPRLNPRRVAFLPLSATPEILLELPRVMPGIVARIEALPSLIENALPKSRPRAAWEARTRILQYSGYPEIVEQFVRLACEHDRDGYTVSEAATALGMVERTLHRLSMHWLGFPPGIVIDLARIQSVAAALSDGPRSLGTLARNHKFPHSAAMSRMFLRFTGQRPGVYRVIGSPIQSENGIALSENGGGSRNPMPVSSRHHDLTRPGLRTT